MEGDKTPSRDVYDQLAGSLSPTYRMLAVFLDKVIQTRVLTDVGMLSLWVYLANQRVVYVNILTDVGM